MGGSIVNVAIVGAPKSGTSTLLALLRQHPRIRSHKPGELNYFVNDEYFASGPVVGFEPFLEQRSRVDSQERLLIKSAPLMFSETAVKRLHGHSQSVLCVALLREPVSRAHSAFLYARRVGYEQATTFEEALSRPPSPTDRWVSVSGRSYFDHGVYEPAIRRLFEHFGRENCEVLSASELWSSPSTVTNRIFERLDLEAYDVDPVIRNEFKVARSPLLARLAKSQGARRVGRALVSSPWARDRLRLRFSTINERSTEKPSISPETREALAKRYSPWNDRLAELLNVDLADWYGSLP